MAKKNDPADKVVPLKKSKCPTCAKPATAKYHPFCSNRCANMDLGRWLNGEYRIPTNEAPSDGDFADALTDGDEDA
ncbi:MAG: DNA gyrase inhibitor YacG [Rhodospirillales bacterium]|nr:DNA gyrase inhibitor YacG [Alphaproteobacteria bacterium]MBL6947726.1 DNA gyrase inhibitor YacG [Rhodospirillales bacterium]